MFMMTALAATGRSEMCYCFESRERFYVRLSRDQENGASETPDGIIIKFQFDCGIPGI